MERGGYGETTLGRTDNENYQAVFGLTVQEESRRRVTTTRGHHITLAR